MHVPAVTAFLAISTQWRWLPRGDGSARRTGLDYTAARAGLEMAGVELSAALWRDIQMIELGALEADREA